MRIAGLTADCQTLTCRTQTQTETWADLSQDLVVKVIHHLIEDGDKAAAANMRRACKDWYRACSKYPAALTCKGLASLRKLCDAFPLAASMQLKIKACTAEDLQPLSACTQLTKIVFEHVLDFDTEAARTFKPDFTYLPESLKALSLENTTPYSRSKSLSNVTQLKHCASMPSDDNQSAMICLLRGLPGLQVGNSQPHPSKLKIFNHTCNKGAFS